MQTFIILMVACVSAQAAFLQSNPFIEFNEEFVEQVPQWKEYGDRFRKSFVVNEDASRAFVSPEEFGVDFDDPATILRFVLASANPAGVVYPTERYFYYEFALGHRVIAGNIRFTHIEFGQLHIGYFDRESEDRRAYRAMTWSTNDEELTLDWNGNSHIASVRFQEQSCHFLIDPVIVSSQPATSFGPELEFITAVRDESGFVFDLFFMDHEERFVYLLRPDFPVPDQLHRVDLGQEIDLLVGARSRFVFAVDEFGNRILVGVSKKAIRENNYYDGPFDQVPPNLELRDKLERSYPYVKWRGGIDQHGNFIEQDGHRVSISPYQEYENIAQLVSQLETLHRPFETGYRKWSALLYDPKEDFHIHAGLEESPVDSEHNIAISRTWPANHWAAKSRAWPKDHEQAPSLSTQANTDVEGSGGD